jgi:hypothetical protein
MPGLTDSRGVSFAAFGARGSYLVHAGQTVRVAPPGSGTGRRAATFLVS